MNRTENILSFFLVSVSMMIVAANTHFDRKLNCVIQSVPHRAKQMNADKNNANSMVINIISIFAFVIQAQARRNGVAFTICVLTKNLIPISFFFAFAAKVDSSVLLLASHLSSLYSRPRICLLP